MRLIPEQHDRDFPQILIGDTVFTVAVQLIVNLMDGREFQVNGVAFRHGGERLDRRYRDFFPVDFQRLAEQVLRRLRIEQVLTGFLNNRVRMHEKDEVLIAVFFKQIQYRPRHHHGFSRTRCHVKQQVPVTDSRFCRIALRVMQVTQRLMLIRS
ncbi:hypothetical protein Xhom_04929 [Xenorhabdus hominickii]|uniref:Uncharacterized protein n=1 Tax=Xenorhabdus hominickii TaxID=351679 RepID=A0A1V0M4T0_XENHO|nr:hypothetical protein [Xenorhabdus hominickii]PHM51449.1 hypothetical protein Xhom_04929 [Xenorhabdus hominickii]